MAVFRADSSIGVNACRLSPARRRRPAGGDLLRNDPGQRRTRGVGINRRMRARKDVSMGGGCPCLRSRGAPRLAGRGICSGRMDCPVVFGPLAQKGCGAHGSIPEKGHRALPVLSRFQASARGGRHFGVVARPMAERGTRPGAGETLWRDHVPPRALRSTCDTTAAAAATRSSRPRDAARSRCAGNSRRRSGPRAGSPCTWGRDVPG
jgi:hypothetical protein